MIRKAGNKDIFLILRTHIDHEVFIVQWNSVIGQHTMIINYQKID